MPEPADRPEPTGEALLRELREVFRSRGVDRLATETIVAALVERQGRPITAHRLARMLKPYGVAPRQFRMPGSGRRVWGYLLSDLAESQGADLSAESRDAAPPAERRDAELSAGVAARDPEAEWALHVVMHAARW
jgi:hypothetical protein